jgi:hypothetical protein
MDVSGSPICPFDGALLASPSNWGAFYFTHSVLLNTNNDKPNFFMGLSMR